MMNHLLSANQLTLHDCKEIFEVAKYIEKHPERYSNELNGKLMATMFFEPSRRTKLSFEAAMLKLGGHVINDDNSASKKGESLARGIKTVSQYTDVIVMRHPENNSVSHYAKYSDAPIINAGDGSNEHPTQAILDLYTIVNNIQDKRDITIMFTGDLKFSRTINSLISLLKNYFKIKIIFANEINEHKLPDNLEYSIVKENKIAKYLPYVEVLYMTRHQKERNAEKNTSFILTNDLAQSMKETAIIMHPFPCNEELPYIIDSNHRSKYFQQIKNGLFIRMAILWDLLKRAPR